MSARTPKVGEVWTGEITGDKCECLTDADRLGNYCWRVADDSGFTFQTGSALFLRPPHVPLPSVVVSCPWHIVWKRGALSCYGYSMIEPLQALLDALDCAGALNVLTGEWVPK